jgi:adenylate cyclase class 2
MAIEIEIKAHVEDFKGIKAGFSGMAGVPWMIEKDDTYWIPPVGIEKPGMALPLSGIRVRRATKANGGGPAEKQILVTYKTKELRKEIEVNDEREFAVSDGKLFEELLIRIGFEPGLRKRKQGWSWSIDEITAELCRIRGGYPQGIRSGESDLGWFAELEIIAEDENPETIGAAKAQLLELLEKAGILKEAIETRYYSEMLRGD